MNQILIIKPSNRKKLYILFFKVQLILSISFALILSIYYTYKIYLNYKYENFSKALYENLSILSIYDSNVTKSDTNLYLGNIKIDKINIEYPIFNNLDYDLLKIAPCRFYGNIENNLCIAGHNYNDNRFFSKLSSLNKNDSIVVTDLNR